ncbi:MAG TPA: hypothetical protein VEC57_05100 [Candidatus Limnocylindrales bacterium]|nr:hypothetical protein [Candidatus Limnocylindrales bacterium]
MRIRNLSGMAAAGMLVVALGAGSAQADRGGCAQPVTSGAAPVATDCLFILRAAVGSATCDKPCICQPKGSGPTKAGDALLCLLTSVGSPTNVDCPCGTPDVQSSDYTFDPEQHVTNPNVAPLFEKTDYIGAFSQDQDPEFGDWTQGWTVEVHGNHTVWEPASGGTLGGATPSANNSCPPGTTPEGSTSLPAPFQGSMDFCRLPQRYQVGGGTLTLTNDNIYLISDQGTLGTVIGDGDGEDKSCSTGTANSAVRSTLVIEPGTVILGQNARNLIVTRGSKVFVNGTAEDPVIMDSFSWWSDWVATGDEVSNRREWGGFIVTGCGRINTCNDATYCDAIVEGVLGTVRYGGVVDNFDWDAGAIRYLVVSHSAYIIDVNGNDTNAITLYGIGRSTEVEYVQANHSGDDGIEIFGGDVVVKHAVVTGALDDSLDTDFGYNGGVQFALVKHYTDEADKGFEMDNSLSSNPTATPVSTPTMANITVVSSTATAGSPGGMSLRSRTQGDFWNLIIASPERSAIRSENDTIDHRAGVLTDNTDSLLEIHNSIVWAPTATKTFEGSGTVTDAEVQMWFQSDPLNQSIDPGVGAFGYPNQVAP